MARPWSDLQRELVYIIFQKLAEEDCRDVLRSAAVCVSWRSVYRHHFKPIIPPLVFLSNAGMHLGSRLPTDASSRESCILFNPVSNMLHEIKSLPEELKGRWFYSASSSFGWLITIGFDKPHRLSLLNLNTRDRTDDLPPADENLDALVMPSRFIISDPPSSSGDDVIVIAVDYFGYNISYSKPGDKSWRRERFPSRVSNSLFYKHEFYVVDYSANIFHINFKNDDIEFRTLVVDDTAIKKTQMKFQKCYLLELNGDLLLVSQSKIEQDHIISFDDEEDLDMEVEVEVEVVDPPSKFSYCTSVVYDVYKLDWSKKKWIKVRDIGNNVILLENCSSKSFGLNQSMRGDWKANCIYVLDDSDAFAYIRVGVHDIKKKTIINRFTYDSPLSMGPLNWMISQI